jgi:hypothetical protein
MDQVPVFETITPLQQRIDKLLAALIDAQWEGDDIKEAMIEEELTMLLAKQEAGEQFDPPF